LAFILLRKKINNLKTRLVDQVKFFLVKHLNIFLTIVINSCFVRARKIKQKSEARFGNIVFYRDDISSKNPYISIRLIDEVIFRSSKLTASIRGKEWCYSSKHVLIDEVIEALKKFEVHSKNILRYRQQTR